MKKNLLLACIFAAAVGSPAAAAGLTVVGVSPGPWLGLELVAFTKATGIAARFRPLSPADAANAPAGADVLLLPPPYMQMAEHAKNLTPYAPVETAHIPDAAKDDDGDYTAIVMNAGIFAYRGAAQATFAALAAGKERIILSAPGQDVDGTAAMLDISHAAGGDEAGLDYLQQVAGRVTPTSETTAARLAALSAGPDAVTDSDLNGACAAGVRRIAIPAAADGTRSAVAMPLYIARAKGGAADSRRLIDFLLSRPAQAALPAQCGIAVRDDLPGSPALAGVTIIWPRWHAVLRGLPGLQARWRAIITPVPPA
jgi:2-aminoethylphosphonate transport system substrate-binding protein